MESVTGREPPKRPAPQQGSVMEVAFGYPRNFLENRYVYVVISPRARGLSVGLDLTPSRACNFDCVYCEVNREVPLRAQGLEVEVLSAELERTLGLIRSGHLRRMAAFSHLPPELLELRHVAISGDGEPTLCPEFDDAIQAVVRLRALGRSPFFRLVLVTNATGLHLPPVQHGLKYFTREDEVWLKLDAGTQAYMDRVNRPHCTLEQVLANITSLGRQRPVVIQSLFPLIEGAEPPESEIEAYARRLVELKQNGAQISLVQIYSAGRPTMNQRCGHLPLKSLSRIAAQVRKATGLTVEVF